MKMRLLLFCFIAVCLRLTSPAGPVAEEQLAIPPQYPQFSFRGTGDPRIVVLERTGAGPLRPAETTAYELIEKGDRLRKLSAFALKNPYMPLTQYVMGGGRFLVTIDQWGGSGTSDNCVVIYDSVFGKATAAKLESFLPENVRVKLSHHPYIKGYAWKGIKSIVDHENFLFYPTSPAECREKGLPFVMIDLRSQTVGMIPVPESLPITAVEQIHRGLVWSWSSGTGPGPDWNVKFEYPAMIKGEVNSEKLPKEFLAFINHTKNACYQLDVTTGDYIRCADDKWVDKKNEQNRPAQKHSK